MIASKPATARFSADAVGETDFAKVDAHVVQPDEYGDLPELTDETMARADVHRGGVLVRRGRGRPKVENPKKLVALRLDPDVVSAFRATGPGWQTRINAVLRRAAKRLARA